MDADIESDAAWVADRIRAADDVVAFTGAGMSTASGIPDFRGDDGIWETEFDPASFHRDRLLSDPAGFWRDRVRLHDRMFPDDVAPNAGHEALARLESRGHLDAVVTQNTDGLHGAAGSERVVELHGNAAAVGCPDCGARFDAAPTIDRVRDGDVPPTCPDCGGVLEPDVVLFGERLPRVALAEANRLAAEADVLLALGSSLSVHPAAGVVATAAADATLVVVNYDETRYDDRAAAVVRADLAAFLPAVEERV